MDNNRAELFEIYKLHAELADRVSQRREGANRLYVSLLTAILALVTAFSGYEIKMSALSWVMTVGGILIIVLSASWFVVIRSYRQLNSGKFLALHELEEKLAYPFFKREWELLEEGGNIRRYWKLTIVETFLPITFSFFGVILIIIGCSNG